MGEAKRRRQLDPNYGTTQLNNEFALIFDDFVNKQTDIAIISKQDLTQPWSERFAYLKPKGTVLVTPQYVSIPISPSQNFARAIFLEYQLQIMASITPRIQQRGWISQINNSKTCDISIVYAPETTDNLNCLETQVFTRTFGKMVGVLMRNALQYFCFQRDNLLIPVVAMPASESDPYYLFCL